MSLKRAYNFARLPPNTQENKTTAQRGIWTICDQVANSLFNLGVGVASARLLPIESFGFFSILFATYLILRGVFRALVLEPIAVNYPKHLAQNHESKALGIAVFLALLAGLLLLAAQVFISSAIDLRIVFLCTISLGALLFTDTRRMLDMVKGNTFSAALLSVSMFTLLVLFIAVLHQSIQTIETLFGVVIVSVFLSLMFLGGIKTPTLHLNSLYQWLNKHWQFSGPLVFEFLASSGLAATAIILIGIVGLQESAAYRGAQMVAAPVHMFFLAIATFIVVEASRSGSVTKVARIAAALMAAVGFGYLTLLLINNFIPELLLGHAAVGSIPVVIPLAAHAVISSVSVISASILKAQGNTKHLVKLRLKSFIPESIAIAIGFYMGSATYMAIFSVIALLIAIPLWIKPLQKAGVIGNAQVSGQ